MTDAAPSAAPGAGLRWLVGGYAAHLGVALIGVVLLPITRPDDAMAWSLTAAGAMGGGLMLDQPASEDSLDAMTTGIQTLVGVAVVMLAVAFGLLTAGILAVRS